MAETQTPHYPTWIKPDLGGDAATWGNVLNTTIDAIDSVVYANQQAGVPIGSLTMFVGAAAPANWLLCNGQSLSTAAPYDKLFAIVGYAFGGSGANFKLPNFSGVFPTGAGAVNSLGKTGGAATHAIAIAELPTHAHPITDVAHNHGANQWAHSHNIATGSHAHTIQRSTLMAAIWCNSGAGTAGLTPGGVFRFPGLGIPIRRAPAIPMQPVISVGCSGANFSCFPHRFRHRLVDHAECRVRHADPYRPALARDQLHHKIHVICRPSFVHWRFLRASSRKRRSSNAQAIGQKYIV